MSAKGKRSLSCDGLDDESMPDEILIKILAKIHANGAIDSKKRSTIDMLRSIGSASRRMRRLCFESMFWEGSDCLLCFKSRENTRQILSHLADTVKITSLMLTSAVIQEAAEFHFRAEEKWKGARLYWDRGVKESLRCLTEVLTKCPSIRTLSVALTKGRISSSFLVALSSAVSLTKLNIQSCSNGGVAWFLSVERPHHNPISHSQFLSVVKNCPNLTHISLNFGVYELDVIDFGPLTMHCPKLEKLSMTNMGENRFAHVMFIDKLSSLSSLNYLKLQNFTIINFHDIAGLTNLQDIFLIDCKLEPREFRAGQRYCVSFVESDIRRFTSMNYMTTSLALHFKFVRCCNLRALAIQYKAKEKVKASVEDCENLERLDLYLNPESVTIEGCPRATQVSFDYDDQDPDYEVWKDWQEGESEKDES